MASEELNALVYTKIPNNLSGSDLTAAGISTLFISPDPSNTASYLDTQLDKTTLKKVCSMNLNRPGADPTTFQTSVRIPVPSNYDFGSNPNATLWQKFGFIDKIINVPASMCSQVPGYDYNSDLGNKFMQLYCANARAFYQDELNTVGGVWSDDEFAAYKPECSCLGKIPSYIKGVQNPTCFFPGCGTDNATIAYLPPSARQSCSATFCTANIDLNNAKVGGSINLNSKVEQNCGPNGMDTSNGVNTNPTPVSGGSSGSPAISAAAIKTDLANLTTTTGIKQSFTSSGNYIGIIIIVIILMLCCSSGLLFLM